MTDLHTIVKNKEASGEILENEASESSKFESAKIKFRQLLEAALPTDCDIDLSLGRYIVIMEADFTIDT